MNSYRGKRVVIMGLGGYENGSGIEAALFFAREGARVLVTDLKPEGELKDQIRRLKSFKNIEFFLGGHRNEDFESADFIFQNPAVPDSSPYLKLAQKKKIPVINDWTVFLERFRGFLIGVTGTRGKSTTTTLIYEMVKRKNKNALLAGNIGVSPLKYLDKIKPETVVVAELSSWLLRGFKAAGKSPQIAVLTNLYPDHLDKYANLNDYYRDKENIFRFQTSGDVLVFNRDNAEVRKRIAGAKAKRIWFSKKELKSGRGVYLSNDSIYVRDGEKKIKVIERRNIPLPGAHNLENILAAVAAGWAFGVRVEVIKKVIRNFPGLPDRLELVRRLKEIDYYNDTTATSPEGTLAALRAFPEKSGRIILLAGGSDKNLDFGNLVKEIKTKAKAVILFSGKASDKIKKELGPKNDFPVREAKSMAEALREVKKIAARGDIVLLSPGAASFGLFKNEFDRGAQFKKLVRGLK